MSEMQWFIILNHKAEGPFVIAELLKMKSITPDTLAWREGMDEWKPIRDIPELKCLFDDMIEEPEEIDEIKNGSQSGLAEGLAITLPQADPPWLFWLIFIIILMIYGILQFFYSF